MAKPSPGQNFGRGSAPSYTKGGMKSGSLNSDSRMDNSGNSYTGDAQGVIGNMTSIQSENLDDPGFTADGRHIFKHGTPYGESAQFNYLPPGMDISNQTMCLINDMPMRKLVDVTYPADGAFAPRDVPE